MSNASLRRLPASFKEKPWGTANLSPIYPPAHNKIGEVWFQADHPLLVKFLFTSARLSVQVHPDDGFAAEHESSRGKTEMWHILRAEPGAQMALGLRESITKERLREAAESGEIVDLLNWIDVHPGDSFFTPAGTIHAIGAGIALCEIQQHSDVTYRIYDYGSNRELHLEKALQVSNTDASVATPMPLPIECRHFRTEFLNLNTPLTLNANPSELLIILEGQGTIAGQPYQQGETWRLPVKLQLDPARDTKALRTWPNA